MASKKKMKKSDGILTDEQRRDLLGLALVLLAAFTALQRQGIPSKFLHFPESNHWVLRPANSLQWHDEVLGWLGRWLEE